MPGRSKLHNLWVSWTRLENSLTEEGIEFVYLDMTKVFDKVNHELLINKLRRLGLNVLNCFQSYLHHRRQQNKLTQLVSNLSPPSPSAKQTYSTGFNLTSTIAVSKTNLLNWFQSYLHHHRQQKKTYSTGFNLTSTIAVSKTNLLNWFQSYLHHRRQQNKLTQLVSNLSPPSPSAKQTYSTGFNLTSTIAVSKTNLLNWFQSYLHHHRQQKKLTQLVSILPPPSPSAKQTYSTGFNLTSTIAVSKTNLRNWFQSYFHRRRQQNKLTQLVSILPPPSPSAKQTYATGFNLTSTTAVSSDGPWFNILYFTSKFRCSARIYPRTSSFSSIRQ